MVTSLNNYVLAYRVRQGCGQDLPLVNDGIPDTVDSNSRGVLDMVWVGERVLQSDRARAAGNYVNCQSQSAHTELFQGKRFTIAGQVSCRSILGLGRTVSIWCRTVQGDGALARAQACRSGSGLWWGVTLLEAS